MLNDSISKQKRYYVFITQLMIISANTRNRNGRNTSFRLHLYPTVFRSQFDLVLTDLLHVSIIEYSIIKGKNGNGPKMITPQPPFRIIDRVLSFFFRYGFLFLVFIILIITCSETTILLCYFHLCAEVK